MKKKTIKEILDSGEDLIYSIKGTSMLPLLHEKEDQVHLKKSDEYNLYDVVLFQSNKKSYILHRIIYIDGDTYGIIGDNSYRVDYKKKEDILGKMVGFYKKTDYISVSDKYYKDYLEEFILHHEEDFHKIYLDADAYFYNRFKEAYYEILRLMVNPEYPLDINKFNILKPGEILRLVKVVSEKKGSHVLGYALNKFDINFPLELKKYLLNNYEISKLRYIRIEEAKAAITKALSEEKIPHFYLKGAEIRSLYKSPYFRWSNDIDLYVDPEYMEKAKKVFGEKLHCKYFSISAQHHVFESEEFKLHFELHYTLAKYIPDDVIPYFAHPFDDAIKDEKEPYLYHQNPDKFYLFHILHVVKHIHSGEFWMPMVSDTYILNKKYTFNNELMKTARLDFFEKSFTNIVNSLYEKNIELSKEESDFEKFLFRDSLDVFSTIARSQSKNPVVYAFRRMFPDVESIQLMYPFAKKVPILIPFAYVVRLCSRVFNIKKVKTGMEHMESFKKAKTDEINILKNVGLYEYLVEIRK